MERLQGIPWGFFQNRKRSQKQVDLSETHWGSLFATKFVWKQTAKAEVTHNSRFLKRDLWKMSVEIWKLGVWIKACSKSSELFCLSDFISSVPTILKEHISVQSIHFQIWNDFFYCLRNFSIHTTLISSS